MEVVETKVLPIPDPPMVEPQPQVQQKRKCDMNRTPSGGGTWASMELMLAHLQRESERSAAESAKMDELISTLQNHDSKLPGGDQAIEAVCNSDGGEVKVQGRGC